MRFYYYAVALPDGQWELRSSLESKQLLYANKDLAMLAAKISCRRHWETTGTACGVRIQGVEGQWADEILFGDAQSDNPVPENPNASTSAESA